MLCELNRIYIQLNVNHSVCYPLGEDLHVVFSYPSQVTIGTADLYPGILSKVRSGMLRITYSTDQAALRILHFLINYYFCPLSKDS